MATRPKVRAKVSHQRAIATTVRPTGRPRPTRNAPGSRVTAPSPGKRGPVVRALPFSPTIAPGSGQGPGGHMGIGNVPGHRPPGYPTHTDPIKPFGGPGGHMGIWSRPPGWVAGPGNNLPNPPGTITTKSSGGSVAAVVKAALDKTYHVKDAYAGTDISLSAIAKRSKAKTGKLPTLKQARATQARDVAARKKKPTKPGGIGGGSGSLGGAGGIEVPGGTVGGAAGGAGGYFDNSGSGDLLGLAGIPWMRAVEIIGLLIAGYFVWTKVVGPRVGRKLAGKRGKR